MSLRPKRSGFLAGQVGSTGGDLDGDVLIETRRSGIAARGPGQQMFDGEPSFLRGTVMSWSMVWASSSMTGGAGGFRTWQVSAVGPSEDHGFDVQHAGLASVDLAGAMVQ